MNKTGILLWLFIIALNFVNTEYIGAQVPADSTVQSFNEFQNNFASPPKRFGSAPLWVWNADVDSANIRYCLDQFKKNAFGGVFVHPRAGLITPYLSDRWLNLYKYTVEEAKRLGLDVWIYDENSYPSGFAGGRVPDAMPSSYDQGEMLEPIKTATIPADTSGIFIFLKQQADSFVDCSGRLSAETGKQGTYYLFKKTYYYKSPWYGGFSYVDLMAKGVTEKFISETMTGYEKVIGNEFGKTVPGIFSDEPNIEVQYTGQIRWTPDLFDEFYKKWHYRLETNLPALVAEVGEWKKVRHNYYQVLLQLFIDRWSKPFSEYTARHSLEWTGHYWEHEWPNLNHGPDNMAMYAWPQRPGIDMLFNQFDEKNFNAQFGNARSVRELASVANQLHKNRTLSETYGGGGWELTFRDMKRLGDWEFALGINTLNQHLSFMTILGARKYDYPQSFSYHEPWWQYYAGLNKYFARLSMASSAGKQVNKILVIEPTTTAWMYYSNAIDDLSPKMKSIGDKFQQFVTLLEKSKVEYDLGSENIIGDHGTESNHHFVVGERAYSTVVLPPGIENIDNKTFGLLQQFAKDGGKIMAFAPLQTIDGQHDDRLQQFYKTAASEIANYDSLDRSALDALIKVQQFAVIADTKDRGDVYHYRRQLNDGEIIFLANSDLQHPASGRIVTQHLQATVLDLFTGDRLRYAVTSSSGEHHVEYHIPPGGSVLFFLSDRNNDSLRSFSPTVAGSVVATQASIVHRDKENVLMIDFCDLNLGGNVLKELHTYDAADTVFKHHGFSEGNPWNTSVQYKDRTIARDTFSKASGFSTTFHFTIDANVRITALKAVVESAHLYTVKINGHLINAVRGEWWLDKGFNVFQIGQWVHAGENNISITASPMSVFAEVEPIYILGDFNLAAAAKGWTITKPSALKIGSWKNQGLAMYGNAVSYSKTFQLNAGQPKKYAVALGKWKGTVAEVTVNGKHAGIIAFDPFTCDISSLLHAGSNSVVVKVIGSLKNTLGPHHNHPKPGLVSPWQWRYIKKYPAGGEYDVYDYGLLEDFTIVEIQK